RKRCGEGGDRIVRRTGTEDDEQHDRNSRLKSGKMSQSKVTDRGASGNQTIPPRSFAAFLCNKCILDRTETGASEVDSLMINEPPSLARMGKPKLLCLITSCCAVLLFLMTVLPAIGRAQTQEQAKPAGSEPSPEPAVPA